MTRLAVDSRFQEIGVGHGLLRDCAWRVVSVAAAVGVRALVTHAKNAEAARFYRRLGFEASPLHELQLMALVKDLKASLQG